MTLAPVLRAAHVGQPPEDAFRLFTEQIGAWWPLASLGVYGPEAGGVAFTTDGRLVERATDGRQSVWGEVLVWEPPSHLAITWHPGRDGAPAGRVDVHFVGDRDGTRIELAHTGWEAFGEAALAARQQYLGPRAWGSVLDCYATVADRRGLPADRADLADLAAAYETFFAEALAGGFGPPAPGEWTAEQVVAHVAVNDDAVAAVCRALIEGDTPSFANAIANDGAVLDALVAGHADLAGLVAEGRRRAEQVVVLLGRCSPAALEQEVPSHLVDGGSVVVDRPLPFGRLAIATQTGYHLPAHTEQLQALRPT